MSSPDDKDLEDLLAGRSDVSRRYRASKSPDLPEEPPAELDRTILAKARAAVDAHAATVSSLPVRNRVRWAVPFALAASVLLTAAIYREGSDKVGVNGAVTPGVVTEQAAAPLSAPVEVASVPEALHEEGVDAVAVTRDEVAQKAVAARAAVPVPAAPPPAPAALASAPEVAVTTVEPAATANVAITSLPSPPPPAAARATPARCS